MYTSVNAEHHQRVNRWLRVVHILSISADLRKKIFDKCCQRATGEMEAYENFHLLCRTKSRYG